MFLSTSKTIPALRAVCKLQALEEYKGKATYTQGACTELFVTRSDKVKGVIADSS